MTIKLLGSPPRVRGKDFKRTLAAYILGITPACAGKSVVRSRRRGISWDHPRVCGEKLEDNAAHRLPTGSPPRVRGKARLERVIKRLWRITPACAGKSKCSHRCRLKSKDHPRVCGEKKKLSTLESGLPGSPPRVRGKAIPLRGYSDSVRITPACAGKRVAFV